MKKILISTTVDPSLSFHQGLAKSLLDRGFEIHFLSSNGPVLKEYSKTFHTHVVEMARTPHLLKDLNSLIKWISVLRREKPDLVLTGTPKAALLGMLASRICCVPHRIYYVQGLRLETARGFFKVVLWFFEWLTARSSTDSIAVSNSLRNELIRLRLCRPDKVRILGSGGSKGIDLEKFSPERAEDVQILTFSELNLNPSLPTIGFVGRLTVDKGIKEFKEALLTLKKRGVKFQAVILGPIEDAVGASVVEDLSKADVEFVAPGTVNNVAQYFSIMDIFCLPTYREGLPNVILEAFASGVPVVATETTGVIDLIKHNETGFLVPVKDSTALADAFEECLGNPEKVRRIASSALHFVREEFDTEIVTRHKVNYIESYFQ